MLPDEEKKVYTTVKTKLRNNLNHAVVEKLCQKLAHKAFTGKEFDRLLREGSFKPYILMAEEAKELQSQGNCSVSCMTELGPSKGMRSSFSR